MRDIVWGVVAATVSVHAAHAVDGDLLDEQFLEHQFRGRSDVGIDDLCPGLRGFGRIEDGGIWCRCHGVSVPCDARPVRGLASNCGRESSDTHRADEGAE